MLWGFFLKIVVADRLAIFVNQVYNNPNNYTGIPILIATYFFAFQIYGDFAGYSLIAIGTAKMMGINLMTNFNRPYLSESIPEFWKRWHISLSTWFKDYVYIPLGGNRVKKNRWLFNIMVVFLVSGLWHGAGWNFVLWGAVHGIFFLIYSYLIDNKVIKEKSKNSFIKIIKILINFNIVCFAWMLFRADSFSHFRIIFINLFKNFFASIFHIPDNLLLSLFSILIVIIVQIIMEFYKIKFNIRNKYARWCIYYLIIFTILIFGVFNEEPFIYFQF
jgi:D-alanyl-lipoteichoic acid acyltransferase DltB (MBOAT superfamily)